MLNSQPILSHAKEASVALAFSFRPFAFSCACGGAPSAAVASR